MKIKCRAWFAENNSTKFGFYGAKGEAHRRIQNGETFMFDYDKDNPKHKIYQIHDSISGTRDMIGEWIQVLEVPGKKARIKI